MAKFRWGKSLKQRFDEKYIIDESTGCWNWKKTSGRRYGSMWLDDKRQQAHRASWQLHIGEIPEGLCVLHKCDNTKCVNPNHLFLGTQTDNMQDMVKKGRRNENNKAKPGELHHNAKLNLIDVINIRAMSHDIKIDDLVGMFDVKKEQIRRIATAERWRIA